MSADDVERGEHVDLLRIHHHCKARWHNQRVGGAWEKSIRTGTLEYGRWVLREDQQAAAKWRSCLPVKGRGVGGLSRN